MDDALLSRMTVVALHKTPMLRIDAIRRDGGTQVRAALDEVVIDDYAAALKNGSIFPPVDVFFDGETNWLADGFHRVRAHEKYGAKEIAVRAHRGSRRDAILFAIEANRAHGLRRTNADKRRAVEIILSDKKWARWSDREISRRAGVSDTFVGDIRRSLQASLRLDRSEDATKTKSTKRKVRTKHGTTTTMNTANIAKASSTRSEARVIRDEKIKEMLDAGHPAADIARKLGVAKSTIGDSKERQKLGKNNPLAKLTAEADATATAWRNAPARVLVKATAAQRNEAIEQLKAAIHAARTLIRQLEAT